MVCNDRTDDVTTRFVWPVPSDDYLRRTLAEGEAATIEHRVDRYRFIWEEFGPPADALLVGGIPSMFALGEMKRSYIYGNFMATVVLAQAFVELSLGGMYSLAGDDRVADGGLARLVARAQDDGHIQDEIAESLNKLRRMRNPYIHHAGGDGPRSYMGRLMEGDFVPPEDLVVKDADAAIRAVVDYMREGSPNWNPEIVQWSELEQDG